MTIKSPISVLVDNDGYATAVTPGTTPANPRGYFSVGVDANGVARVVKLDSSGGITLASGTTITANIGTTNGLALDATLTGGTQVSKIGNGTITAQLLASNPAGTENALVVRNIPSGTQTISGTITAAQATAANLNATVVGSGSAGTPASGVLTVQGISGGTVIPVSASALPLPSGASTETTLSGLSAKFGSLGQKTMAGSAPVVIASDQGALTVSGSVTANIGTTNGLALDATLTGGTQRTKITDGTNNAAVINTTPTTEYGVVVRPVGSITVDQFSYEQRRILGVLTTNSQTVDQVICSYTVPANKTAYIISYMISAGASSVSGYPVKIGKGTLTETAAPGGTDTNVFRSLFLVSKSVVSEQFDYPSFPATAGEVIKLTVTPDGVGQTVWRASIVLILK
jgi:hypothetical protein